MEDRRDFLKAATVGAVAFAALRSPLTSQASPAPAPLPGSEHGLPPLPYAYNALEPYIDEQTMRLHHDKHHAGYVKGLNTAEAALAKAREAGDYTMIEYWSKKAAFNGGGHYLHTLFWNVMAPPGMGGGGVPGGDLLSALNENFGSVDAFKSHFAAAAKAVEGSGWALLHFRPLDGTLHVLQAENQHKLSPWGTIPIMGIDVWEHAYYLKYQNDRAAYVDNWWNVVNWSAVEHHLHAAMG